MRPLGNPRVYVVVLNWNGWADTLECLESVFRSDYPDYRVIVCDNDSQDGSVERLQDWAEGRLEAPVPADSRLRSLSSPPVPKPISYVMLDRAEAERGGNAGHETARMEIVRTGGNLGFAGGNNVALRSILARGDFDYVWLLNNDTVVRPDALGQLVLRMHDKPDAGFCGSTLRRYDAPEQVQAFGGAAYNRWLGIARLLDGPEPPAAAEEVEARLAYVMAASLLASRSLLEGVGVLSEDYFLFFEELDWATRARGRFTLAYAPASVVYHKGGTSTGSWDPHHRLTDFHMTRSQLVYARKHTPGLLLPLTLLRHAAVLLNSLVRGRFGRIATLFSVYRDVLQARRGRQRD